MGSRRKHLDPVDRQLQNCVLHIITLLLNCKSDFFNYRGNEIHLFVCLTV